MYPTLSQLDAQSGTDPTQETQRAYLSQTTKSQTLENVAGSGHKKTAPVLRRLQNNSNYVLKVQEMER